MILIHNVDKFEMNCHENIKFHHSFIYVYQTKILIHNISLNIKV